jgi:hypothetical protein
MSFTKNKYDACFMKQYQQSNRSIFDYVIDNSRFVNKNECNNYTAPFLTYIPSGVPKMNVDIENDLKGMTKPVTKCSSCKYHPEDESLAQSSGFGGKSVDVYPNNKNECKQDYNIIPNGYLQRK